MRIKKRDLALLIENYLMQEGISSDAEADAFRLWMAKNHPKYKDPKTGGKLDKVYSGKKSSNNKYVTRAFKKHGKDYERHLKDTADKESAADQGDSMGQAAARTLQGAKDVVAAGIEKFKPTNMSVDILPKSISQINSGDIKNAKDIDMLAGEVEEKGSIGDKIFLGVGRFLGKSAQGAREVASYLGVDYIADRIDEASGTPLHWQALFHFILQRTSLMRVQSEEAQKAMHYVCQRAQRRHGGKGSKKTIYIRYGDYKKGQPKGVNLPTYQFGFSGKMAGQGNPYGQLSLLFGQCTAKELPDGTYEVNDQYDFNADQTKHSKDPLDNIPSYENVSGDLKKVYDGVFGGNPEKKAASLLEPLLIKIEALTGYAGFPTTMKTINPDAKDEPSLYQKAKTGLKSAIGLDTAKDYIPYLEESKIRRRKNKMKISRRELRRMILREMRMLNETDAQLNAKKGAALQQLIQKGVIANRDDISPEDVIAGIGKTAEEAYADSENNPNNLNKIRGTHYPNSSPELKHQLSDGTHVVVAGFYLAHSDDDVEDF